MKKIIEFEDPVYKFNEVMNHIDLKKYTVQGEHSTGRPRYDEVVLLKIILFAFMENGYVSTRSLEKLCKTDIRYMWLLDDNQPPSHMTIANFMNSVLKESIEEIFKEVNEYIFSEESVDMNHLYIDGTTLMIFPIPVYIPPNNNICSV